MDNVHKCINFKNSISARQELRRLSCINQNINFVVEFDMLVNFVEVYVVNACSLCIFSDFIPAAVSEI